MRNGAGIAAMPNRLPEGYIRDWTKVRPCEHLEVCRHGLPIAAGPADCVTHDGSMIWIIQDYPRGRSIFHRRDGVSLRRQPRK